MLENQNVVPLCGVSPSHFTNYKHRQLLSLAFGCFHQSIPLGHVCSNPTMKKRGSGISNNCKISTDPESGIRIWVVVVLGCRSLVFCDVYEVDVDVDISMCVHRVHEYDGIIAQ